MTSYVLDASALLVLLRGEPGAELVRQALVEGAAISAVNLSEVVAKLSEAGRPEEEMRSVLDLEVDVVDFGVELAYRTGFLRPPTRGLGLSLGDRACLALGQHLNVPVLTADRTWQHLQIGVTITVVR